LGIKFHPNQPDDDALLWRKRLLRSPILTDTALLTFLHMNWGGIIDIIIVWEVFCVPITYSFRRRIIRLLFAFEGYKPSFDRSQMARIMIVEIKIPPSVKPEAYKPKLDDMKGLIPV
jgi:hypothetical protein